MTDKAAPPGIDHLSLAIEHIQQARRSADRALSEYHLEQLRQAAAKSALSGTFDVVLHPELGWNGAPGSWAESPICRIVFHEDGGEFQFRCFVLAKDQAGTILGRILRPNHANLPGHLAALEAAFAIIDGPFPSGDFDAQQYTDAVESGAKALVELKAHFAEYQKTVDEAAVLRHQLAHARDQGVRLMGMVQTLRDAAQGNYWLWQGDGEDHLESLTCPVLIAPGQLMNLIAAAQPAAATIESPPGPQAV